MNTEHAIHELCARLPEPDLAAAQAVRARLDRLTKPPGSLGQLEELLVQLAAITGRTSLSFASPAVLVAAGDHGVTQEGVSPYPQSVTGQMVTNFLAGGAAINALAASAGARVLVVDAGVATPLPDHPQLLRVGTGHGTANLLHGPAMQRSEVCARILAGARIIDAQAQAGLDLLALGEMGIGNTTAAACLTSAFTDLPPELSTGRGTGLDDLGLEHKRAVVTAALDRAQPDPSDPLGVLAELGGFELALLVGAALAAAAWRIPVVLDGYVATSAALAAATLAPGLRHFLIAGHRSTEPGHAAALAYLELHPLLTLNMRLGEGSGAVLAFPLIQAATRILREMATFDQAGVDERT